MLPCKALPGIVVLALAWLAAGCVGLGARTIRRDRFDYVQSLRESWKEEMLLNIVGLRYTELPVFLQVTSVINQYHLEGSISGTVSTGDDSLTAGAAISAEPTITYVPLAGEEFTRQLLTPVSPSAVVSLLQSGWPASLVFRTAVRSINGIGSQLGKDEDPRYLEIIQRLERVQRANGIGMRVTKKDEDQLVLLFFPTAATAEVEQDLTALHEMLGIQSDTHQYRLVYGQAPTAADEIAILTRSAIELLIEFGTYVDVPEEDVLAGRTQPTRGGKKLEEIPDPLIRIHSGPDRPSNPFVSVRFRERWFWIDDSDLRSKRMLSFAMLTMSLTSGNVTGMGPVVTVSTGG